MDELVLVGVDLGARSLQKVHSEDAVGCSFAILVLKFQPILVAACLRRASCEMHACLSSLVCAATPVWRCLMPAMV